eukprot:scaffold10816_cov85-Cylindrotheca_fusiformis.AAC.1
MQLPFAVILNPLKVVNTHAFFAHVVVPHNKPTKPSTTITTMVDNHSLVFKQSHVAQHSDLRSVGNGASTASGSGDQSAQNPSRPVYNAPIVAKGEEKNIIRARCLVALILVVAVATVGTSTYILLEDQAQRNFENQFTSYASEIVSVSRQKADQIFDSLDSFSIMVGSQAAVENELLNTSWPFYTIPDFSVKAERLVDLIGGNVPLMIVAPVVEEDERDAWAEYSKTTNPVWFQESLENEGNTDLTVDLLVQRTVPFIHKYAPKEGIQVEHIERPGDVLPNYQQYPLRLDYASNALTTGYDIISFPRTRELYDITKERLRPTIGFAEFFLDSETVAIGSQVLQPIYDTADTTAENRRVVAVVSMLLYWLDFFRNILTQGQDGVVVVLRSGCLVNYTLAYGENITKYLDPEELIDEDVITYQVDGPDVILLGYEDLRDPRYDSFEVAEVFVDLGFDEKDLPEGKCVPSLTLHIYPSEMLEATFQNSDAAIYTSAVVVIFVFTSLVFLLYDYFVGRRQRIVMDRIMRQDKIVANVFPAAIRDRLYAQAKPSGKREKETDPYSLDDLVADSNDLAPAPLADLFPSVSVVYADIVGFTAWSSAREPQQVFLLLESIYHSLDKIAYRHDVFKVETVGDCYVAAAGLPEPVDNHAVLACKFALDCLKKMRESTIKLEVSLGPDTADLALRIGIHSGQVTAGVLRGERSRFQLFGDTMNTASRMEHSGERDRVQISQSTADNLAEAGLSHWTIPREKTIYIKGKGDMQTYWLCKTKPSRGGTLTGPLTQAETVATAANSSEQSDQSEYSETVERMDKKERLVEWTVVVLTSLLQQIIASRGGVLEDIKSLSAAESVTGKRRTVLEEFVPIIPLKRFQEDELRLRQIPSSIDIGNEVTHQLRKFLLMVAGMYRDNSFHNFEHAIHVTASVKKLLARIVNVNDGNGLEIRSPDNSIESIDLVNLAGHSYGITSDPLTQFAVVFSAIIHDVDHPGVPNTQLVKENTRSAQIYKKSIAEQNSVHLAWEILMSPEFSALRACIYQTKSELRRFRQLVVNTVMATDIADKELQALRKDRWEEAFSNVKSATESADEDVVSEDRKATIVIEHLIQASDVSHTMQHWHIYKAWNEKFFMECYGAYKAGRADSDPSENWYKGEIGFFDFYVIPLARKLDSCGVFGVSSDEYLNYARSNREEWVREGEAMVKAFVAKFNNRQQSG